MILEKYVCSLLQTNTILLGSQKRAVVVDPGFKSAEWVLKKAKEHSLTIEKILLTHGHFDHVMDVASLKEAFGAAICIHKNDQESLKNPPQEYRTFFARLKGVSPDILWEGDESFMVGDLSIKVLHTPGHTLGSVCYYLEKQQLLLSGDTLFQGTIGRLNIDPSEYHLMWASLRKLSKLPPKTRVIPGHGEETTIGEESYLDHAEEFFP